MRPACPLPCQHTSHGTALRRCRWPDVPGRRATRPAGNDNKKSPVKTRCISGNRYNSNHHSVVFDADQPPSYGERHHVPTDTTECCIPLFVCVCARVHVCVCVCGGARAHGCGCMCHIARECVSVTVCACEFVHVHVYMWMCHGVSAYVRVRARRRACV